MVRKFYDKSFLYLGIFNFSLKIVNSYKGLDKKNGQNRVYPMVMWPLSDTLLIQRPKQPQDASHYPTLATFSSGVPNFDYSTREGYPIIMPPTR